MPKAAKALTSAMPAAPTKSKADASRPSRGGVTVTVGCKLPNGLMLRLQTMQTIDRPVMGGGTKEVKEWYPNPDAQTYTLNGAAVPVGAAPRFMMAGGFAMTSGIPKAFMDAWMEQNENLDIVKSGQIIVHENRDYVMDKGRDKRAVRSGLEAIRPGDDPRIPKRRDRESGKVVDDMTMAEESAKPAEVVEDVD